MVHRPGHLSSLAKFAQVTWVDLVQLVLWPCLKRMKATATSLSGLRDSKETTISYSGHCQNRRPGTSWCR